MTHMTIHDINNRDFLLTALIMTMDIVIDGQRPFELLMAVGFSNQGYNHAFKGSSLYGLAKGSAMTLPWMFSKSTMIVIDRSWPWRSMLTIDTG